MLELAMEYTGALGTIIFDESCHLRDLTEAQVGHNQFTMDVAVDRLDREVDHASEWLSALEGKVTDLEAGYMELLALGQEQVETTIHLACALGQLATMVLAQQGKIWAMEECQGHSTLMLPVYYSAPSQGQLVQLAVLTR